MTKRKQVKKRRLCYSTLFTLVLFSGCHEADRVLYPVTQITEELNTTAANFSTPLDGLPFADIRFKQRGLVLEKKF